MNKTLRQRLNELYAAYAAGQVEEALTAYDDYVTFTSYAPVDVFPYLGRQQGKEALAATLRAVHAEFEHLVYTPVFTVTD